MASKLNSSGVNFPPKILYWMCITHTPIKCFFASSTPFYSIAGQTQTQNDKQTLLFITEIYKKKNDNFFVFFKLMNIIMDCSIYNV